MHLLLYCIIARNSIPSETSHVSGGIGHLDNEVREGPAVLSGSVADLWIYIAAPILGGTVGVLGNRVIASGSVRMAGLSRVCRRNGQ